MTTKDEQEAAERVRKSRALRRAAMIREAHDVVLSEPGSPTTPIVLDYLAALHERLSAEASA